MANREAGALTTLYRGWAAALAAEPEMPLDELRAMFEHWGDVTAEPSGLDYLETDAGGVPALWAVPKGCAADRVVLCLHGGGYVTASMYTHRKLYGHLAKVIGCRALIPHYRRAPEHVHPAQVDDAVAAYRWLLDQRIAPAHIATTGDSAGGALAITTLLRARERRLPLPAAAMPLSPWVDMEIGGDSLDTNRDKDALVQREIVAVMAQTFLGEGGNRRDPLANPLHAELAGLPPIYIQVGGDEALLDDSRRLAERASDAGCTVKLDIFPEMQHVFQFSAGHAAEADDAIARLAAWVRPLLGLG
ncbi:MAG TPA: alpha/beta hydrolase [Stellaceae bacterium]|nr:alpha/beta hydrolase [Stellaceae bacterium]